MATLIPQVEGRKWRSFSHAIRVTAVLCGGLVALHLLGYYSYAQEAREYAKRVYGYYETYNVLRVPAGGNLPRTAGSGVIPVLRGNDRGPGDAGTP